jgi:hypothetical protein
MIDRRSRAMLRGAVARALADRGRRVDEFSPILADCILPYRFRMTSVAPARVSSSIVIFEDGIFRIRDRVANGFAADCRATERRRTIRHRNNILRADGGSGVALNSVAKKT